METFVANLRIRVIRVALCLVVFVGILYGIEPAGEWNFDDITNLKKATIGSDLTFTGTLFQ